jgi:hypothetical protein
LEPYYNWRHLYTAEEDELSPFHGRHYSEFEFTNAIYDHVIHPQWDNFGSTTLFVKILFADYDEGFAILEFIGEWNDCIHNDIMFLKRDVLEHLMGNGINKFILIAENILNFHPSDDLYYEEWWDEVEDTDGWISMVNVRDHVSRDMSDANIDQYFIMGGSLNHMKWRTLDPAVFCELVGSKVTLRIDV